MTTESLTAYVIGCLSRDTAPEMMTREHLHDCVVSAADALGRSDLLGRRLDRRALRAVYPDVLWALRTWRVRGAYSEKLVKGNPTYKFYFQPCPAERPVLVWCGQFGLSQEDAATLEARVSEWLHASAGGRLRTAEAAAMSS